jgi:haloacetate dehalogenase
MTALDAFSRAHVEVNGARMLVRRAGSGPAVLLLHGYPETHLAWRDVAPDLATQFTLIAADLPGYGDSLISDDVSREPFSKRAMGRMLAELMDVLGLSRFAVVGHDRGARAAYRLALDFPQRVAALAVLDVIPILDMADRLTYQTAGQMAHWLWLAQHSDVPERLIGLDPDLYVRHILEMWGGSRVIDASVIAEYVRCMRKPEVRRAISAEYQADQFDLADDRADRANGRRIQAPVLAVWGKGGFAEQFGDPIAIWRNWADQVSGRALACDHFMMEESPWEVSALLASFLVETVAEARSIERKS